MEPTSWIYRHDEDNLQLDVPVALPAGTEHLKIHIDNVQRSIALELWGSSFDAPLQVVDLQFRPLAAAYLSEAQHVIVRFPMLPTTAWFSLLAEIHHQQH